jgi:hypothetical protein
VPSIVALMKILRCVVERITSLTQQSSPTKCRLGLPHLHVSQRARGSAFEDRVFDLVARFDSKLGRRSCIELQNSQDRLA